MKYRCERGENEVIARGLNSPFDFSVFIAEFAIDSTLT